MKITDEEKRIEVIREPSGKARVKPPTFDGKSLWQKYLRQFEAAAKANEWSPSDKATALIVSLRDDTLDIFQTMPLDEQEDYQKIVKRLEMRFGHEHLKGVFRVQLKNLNQKHGQSLQE